MMAALRNRLVRWSQKGIHIFVVYKVGRRTVMSIGQSLLPEFDQEMQGTRRVLERCPEEKWNWKPHEKSGTLGWLAGHVANMVSWLPYTIQTEELDYAPVGGPSFEPPKITNRKELLAEFDKNVADAKSALAGVSDAEMMKNWRSEEHTSELQSQSNLVCRLLLEKKKEKTYIRSRAWRSSRALHTASRSPGDDPRITASYHALPSCSSSNRRCGQTCTPSVGSPG